MKRESLGWLVAAGMLVVICMGAMAQNDQPTGRYQVASGVSQTRREGGEPHTISVVLLVDTVTGQTRALYAPEGMNIRWTGILQTDGKP